MRRILLAALPALAVLAGCVGTDSPDTPEAVASPVWAEHALFAGGVGAETAFVADHDHSNATLHKGLSTPNFQVLSHDSLLSPYFDGAPAGTAWCGDVAAPGERRIAVVHSFASDVGISILDVTDPGNVSLIGELVLPFAFTYDAAVFEDGRFAAIASNIDNTVERAPAMAGLPDLLPGAAGVPFLPYFRDACGNERAVGSNVDYMPYGYSTILVDLADPANPVVTSHFPHGVRNLHSVSVATIDGTRYVASSGLQAVPCTSPAGVPPPPPGFPPYPVPLPPIPTPACQALANAGNPRAGNLLSHFVFYTVEESPASQPMVGATGAKLVPHSIYSYVQPDAVADAAAYDSATALAHNGHVDATLQKHPVTGDLIAYLADWDGGLIVARIDGPGLATQLSNFYKAQDATLGYQMTGNLHSVRPLEDLRDGRHYTLVGQEVVGKPQYRPTGEIILLDTTDPTMPTPMARWTLPVELEWSPADGLLFSTHYPVMSGDHLFVPLYHGGVWVADASQANWPELPTLGVFMPDIEPDMAPAHGSHAPEVLEALVLGNDTLLVFDGNSGAYVVEFLPEVPVVPALPYTKDAWITPAEA